MLSGSPLKSNVKHFKMVLDFHGEIKNKIFYPIADTDSEVLKLISTYTLSGAMGLK